MNKLIAKLYDQAIVIEDGGDYVCGELDPVKFAELIVFECVKAVMDGTKEGDHYAQRIENHFDNGDGGILHFGVEE